MLQVYFRGTANHKLRGFAVNCYKNNNEAVIHSFHLKFANGYGKLSQPIMKIRVCLVCWPYTLHITSPLEYIQTYRNG